MHLEQKHLTSKYFSACFRHKDTVVSQGKSDFMYVIIGEVISIIIVINIMFSIANRKPLLPIKMSLC